MDPLELFALFVLLTLVMTVIGAAYFLGALPGKIAIERNHPQADAVRVCGWLGLATLGILWPVALVWAYWKSESPERNKGVTS